MNELLKINDLHIQFKAGRDSVNVVRGINLTIHTGEIVGVVGESGCGKSVTSLAVMGLLPEKTGRIVKGDIQFDNNELTNLKEKQYRKLRGNQMSMIFQEPMTSLNPVFTIGEQLSEPLRQHQKMTKKEIRNTILKTLKRVGLPRPDEIIDEYPHQLSGGMRQRVMISLALLCRPKLIIADEPTTALDVTIQAQILDLLKEIGKTDETSLMLITHDLGVVAEMCDRVVVMYAGEIVEEAEINEIFDNPLHPYTQGLMQSLPSNNSRKGELYSIKGQVPKPSEIGVGCAFANRCPVACERCFTEAPPMFKEGKHGSKCWLSNPAFEEVNTIEQAGSIGSK